MPGAIYTYLQRHTGGRGSGRARAHLIKTVQQGAATSVLLTTSLLLEGVGGRYYFDCNETEVVDRRSGTLHGVARYAVDPDNGRRLWALSEKLLAQEADLLGRVPSRAVVVCGAAAGPLPDRRV